jgi:hypothetical protein
MAPRVAPPAPAITSDPVLPTTLLTRHTPQGQQIKINNTKQQVALNQGEICTCPSRLLVHEDIYEKFIARVIERTEAIKMGNPLI